MRSSDWSSDVCSSDLVDAVWYRRAIHPVGLDDVPEEFRRFAVQELRYLLEGLLPETGGTRWVNPIGATERAERKVRQLALAPRYGLQIPAKIISSDPRELQAFAKPHRPEARCVGKEGVSRCRSRGSPYR